MFVRSQQHESEKIKWIVIATMAAVIAFGLVTALGAAETLKPPGMPSLLPSDIRDWRRPMSDANINQSAQQDRGVEVWRALGLQQECRYAEAMLAWHELTLTSDVKVWKYVALGQASLATGDLVQAEKM